MQKRLIFTIILTLLAILLISCQGEKAVTSITITGGLKAEYNLNEKPDFSSVTALISYNDGTSEQVDAMKLIFGTLDTSSAGIRQLTVKYGGYTHNVQVTVKGEEFSGSGNYAIMGTYLPESIKMLETNKADFKNKGYGYVVGDDNPFYFTLTLAVIDLDTHEKKNVTSYTSASNVYLKGSDAPLADDELIKYVTIDEEANSFDFTEEAIGKSFKITTRPRDCEENKIATLTKSIEITVVDGYNVRYAWELNYLTNTDFGYGLVIPNDSRTQSQIVDDFLLNEKGVTRPTELNAIVLHNDLVIKTTDIPSEYFLDKNRQKELYDYISVFNYESTEQNKTFMIHGNYFAIYSHELPTVVPDGYGNQTDSISEGQLFRFSVNVAKDMYFDHTQYSTTIKNLMLVDDDHKSDNIEDSNKAMLGLIAIKTQSQIVNLDNIKIKSYYISYFAEYDYQTVNISDSIFQNSWQNHIFLRPENPIQSEFDEPLDQALYPRLTLNVKSSTVTQSGGPAIISHQNNPSYLCNAYSGSKVDISSDCLIESWVTGEEAWFTSMRIGFAAEMIKNLNKLLLQENSSFITEKTMVVNGKETTFKAMNIVMVNLLVPDLSGGWEGILNQMYGTTDIDGKVTIGGKTVLDMDDCTKNGKKYNFKDITIAENKTADNHIFSSSAGDVAITNANGTMTELKGDISAKTDHDYLALYIYTLGIVLGDYHTIMK